MAPHATDYMRVGAYTESKISQSGSLGTVCVKDREARLQVLSTATLRPRSSGSRSGSTIAGLLGRARVRGRAAPSAGSNAVRPLRIGAYLRHFTEAGAEAIEKRLVNAMLG